MKFVRILLSIVLLLVLISAIAMACLMLFVDPNKLKPIIAEEVEKKTGYHLAIDGKLSWSFYPLLGVKIDHMTMSAPKSTVAFLEASDVTLATEAKKLIRGERKLEGEVSVGDVKLMNVHATNAHLNVSWRDKVLNLEQITAGLYDGTLTGDIHGHDFSTTPKWNWVVQFDQIQVKPLLQDINGADSRVKIAGVGNVKMSASAEGNNRDEIISHLNGATEFSLNKGVLEGVDINYIIHSADSVINKQPIVPPANDLTSFDSFTGGLIIKNGVAETNNLKLLAPSFKAEGTGSVNLLYQGVNLQLQVTPQNAQTNWEIPVIVTGSLSRLDVRLDSTELRKLVFKDDFDKMRKKVKEEIKEHVPGKTGDFLQKILGR